MSMNSLNPKQLGEMIYKSYSWLILRRDKEGLHLHTPDQEGLSLIVEFLASSDDIRKMVLECLKAGGFR